MRQEATADNRHMGVIHLVSIVVCRLLTNQTSVVCRQIKIINCIVNIFKSNVMRQTEISENQKTQ